MNTPLLAIEAASIICASVGVTLIVAALRRARLVQHAQQIAADAHAGTTDHAGMPYILHPHRVAARVKGDWRARIVALLHDVVEDTPVTEVDLRLVFPDDIVDAVVAITHLPNEPRLVYWARVKANPLARKVKLADIADNTDPARVAVLRAKDPARADRLARKYAEAIEFLTAPEVEPAA